MKQYNVYGYGRVSIERCHLMTNGNEASEACSNALLNKNHTMITYNFVSYQYVSISFRPMNISHLFANVMQEKSKQTKTKLSSTTCM